MNDLSIVIPCTRSAAGLPTFLDTLASYLMENPSDTDVIVVVSMGDAHLDATVTSMRERYPWVQVTFLERIGTARRFGALARFGIAYSTSRYVALVSPYGEDDLAALPAMLAALRKGAQIAQATRYAHPGDAARVSRRFRWYQHIYRVCVRFLLGHTVTDSTYGYKMFDRVYLIALGLTQNGYALSPEITLKGLLGGGRVAYVPTAPQPSSAGDFQILRDGPAYAWVLVRGVTHRIGIPWF
ncbi:hypothetical protein HY480_01105 [Candidatus Uhrbacteria bacterium]|nr:hypothetical protein [Candidatus Uhrbacteria bacterium]